MTEKARDFKNIELGEHLATYEVNRYQVCNMISYKSDVLEKQSLSEVKMDRDSPICERVGNWVGKEWVKRLQNTLKTMFLNAKLQRV